MGKSAPKQMSGVKEIARRAGVSIATVDRVIHNRTGVSESTKKKINDIIREIGFEPNMLASRLASKRVTHLAVLLPKSQETDFWQAPLRGIDRAFQEIKQYGITFSKYFFDLNDKGSFELAATELLKEDIHGVLIAPSFIEEANQLVNELKQRRVPYVFINSDIPQQNSLCYIGPHLFRSGYQAAYLVDFGKPNGDIKVLILNISKEIDAYHHILRKEEGFRTYFSDKRQNGYEIVKVDIKETSEESVSKHLSEQLKRHPDISTIFVTNSRVGIVAGQLEKLGATDLLLIGYDFLKDNIEYLKKGVIDFLICQKPEEQGYKGIMALYQHLVFSTPIVSEQYMPIDIITIENYQFYHN